MSRWGKIAAIVAAVLVILIAAALITIQTPWFQNFVKDKVVAAVEDSTGGKVDVGSFRFDLWRLTVRITDVTLHGTEAPGTTPLAHAALLELRLKLFAGLKHAVDLQYLGVNQPHVNLIVNADGTTNIPAPKIKQPPSQTSGLETVIDLAIGQFRVEDGLIAYSQKTSAFAAQGKDLSVLLNFNDFNSTYGGRLQINPLVLTTGAGAPLNVTVDLPLMIEKDAVSISGGRLNTPQSQILLNAGLRDLNSPQVTARVSANLALSELNIGEPHATQHLVADLSGGYDDKNGEISVQAAHLKLGQSNFNASGAIAPKGTEALQFNGKLALDELSRMFKVAEPKPLGVMQLNGHARMDGPKNYALDAEVNALGGHSTIKALLENKQKLNLNVHLSNFAIDQSGYSGVIGGVVEAVDDLTAKGTTRLAAQAQIGITQGRRGVPVSGQINGQFLGASNTIRLNQSFVTLPHTRLDVSGDINKQLNALLVSRNLVDFSPLVKTLPVTLGAGGAARVDAQIEGNLSAPQIKAHATLDQFAAQGTPFQQLALDLAASQNGATVHNGTLKSSGLDATFIGSLGLHKWTPLPRSPLEAHVNVTNGQLKSILALAGQKDETASGTLNAQIQVNGTFGDPLGTANLEAVNGTISGQPFQKVQGHVDLAHELITLTGFEVDAAGGQLLARGSFRHPADSFQTGHADFNVTSNGIQLAQVQPLQAKSPGVAGSLKLAADGSGDLRKAGFQLADVKADFSALGLQVNHQAAGDLTAQAHTVNGNMVYTVHSNFAGSLIQVDGQTALSRDYQTNATALVKDLQLEPVLAMAGQGQVPVKGVLSLHGTVSGTAAAPDALVSLALSKAVVYSEPLNSLTTTIHYSPTMIDVSKLKLDTPAGTLTAAAHFAHLDGDFNNGRAQVHLASSTLDLSKINKLPVTGDLKLSADVAGTLKNKELLLSDVEADVRASQLRATSGDAAGRNLGEVNFRAKTEQHVAHYNLDSNLAQSNLQAAGQTELLNDYVTHAKLTFGNVKYSNIAAVKPDFDVSLDGNASVDGPLLKMDALTGRLQLNEFSFDAGARGRHVHLATDAPAILVLEHSVIQVQHLKLQDAKTYLEAGGSFSLKDGKNALGLKVDGNADLSILENVDRDFYSSGNVLLDALVHGSAEKPLINGRLELKNANVNYLDFSNGLSNGNGVIILNGSNANIEKLTGESGGGKISLTGFAGLTPTAGVFNIRATANKVRTRYSDASVTSNADITLAGNTNRSTLSGTVTIQRIAYSSSSDAGSFLTTASAPPSSPAAPSPFLSGLRLDLRVVTAADVRVVSTYSDKLTIISNLTVSGTAQNPGIVGRVSVTNGQLEFFGNTYTVNTGNINFYNVNAIQPILDLSLETLAQGVDVTLGVTGPVNDLKLSYRSDPPLSFEQIVQLLATNTTPADPTIAAHQPTPPQESTSQMGESAVLGQAIANPLASRVQRVFGLSQFKIDPSIGGNNGQPSARVTLQQKITSNLTFTYITDVTQTNSEIIRVTLDLTPKISAVALRDYNGNVSVELFYKFQVR